MSKAGRYTELRNYDAHPAPLCVSPLLKRKRPRTNMGEAPMNVPLQKPLQPQQLKWQCGH